MSFVKIFSILIWIKWQGNKASSELVCYYELFLINMFEIKKKVVLTEFLSPSVEMVLLSSAIANLFFSTGLTLFVPSLCFPDVMRH